MPDTYDPRSLVGSIVHVLKDGYTSQQGIVAAEPQPGWYLVEWRAFAGNEPTFQSLHRIEAMTDWRFYCDQEWATRSALQIR